MIRFDTSSAPVVATILENKPIINIAQLELTTNLEKIVERAYAPH